MQPTTATFKRPAHEYHENAAHLWAGIARSTRQVMCTSMCGREGRSSESTTWPRQEPTTNHVNGGKVRRPRKFLVTNGLMDHLRKCCGNCASTRTSPAVLTSHVTPCVTSNHKPCHLYLLGSMQHRVNLSVRLQASAHYDGTARVLGVKTMETGSLGTSVPWCVGIAFAKSNREKLSHAPNGSPHNWDQRVERRSRGEW